MNERSDEAAPERYLLIVQTNAVPGREAEYEDWYEGRHLSDMLALEGFEAAQVFRAHSPGLDGSRESEYRYLAIYEVPASGLEAARASLESIGRGDQADAPRVPISDALARRSLMWWVTPISERITAAPDQARGGR